MTLPTKRAETAGSRCSSTFCKSDASSGVGSSYKLYPNTHHIVGSYAGGELLAIVVEVFLWGALGLQGIGCGALGLPGIGCWKFHNSVHLFYKLVGQLVVCALLYPTLRGAGRMSGKHVVSLVARRLCSFLC